MSSFVIKPDPSEDLYVIWSTVTDGPGFRGTWAEVAAELRRRPGRYGTDPAEDRLLRADRNGSSAFDSFGWWDEKGFVVRWDADGNHEIGSRWLPRNHLHAWLMTGDETLTQPIET